MDGTECRLFCPKPCYEQNLMPMLLLEELRVALLAVRSCNRTSEESVDNSDLLRIRFRTEDMSAYGLSQRAKEKEQLSRSRYHYALLRNQ